MSGVSIAAAHEAVEVDLWGATFHTRRITRSVQKAINDAQDKITPDIDDDVGVALLCEVLDAVLEPEAGKRKKASAFIQEKWMADELTVGELEAFVENVFTASRPT